MMNLLGLESWVAAAASGAGEQLPGATSLSVMALDLPRSLTPTLAGLVVGSVVGVVGFLAVVLLVGRAPRRGPRRAPAARAPVVLIPSYGTTASDLGLAGFVPSSALSARAFAKMGWAEGPQEASWSQPPSFEIPIEVSEGEDGAAPMGLAAVTVTPVLLVGAAAPEVREPGPVAIERRAPHPLGSIKASSSAMRAAPIEDLAYDEDAPTLIAASPPSRSARGSEAPRIRPVAPAGPRFPEATPRLLQVMAPSPSPRG